MKDRKEKLNIIRGWISGILGLILCPWCIYDGIRYKNYQHLIIGLMLLLCLIMVIFSKQSSSKGDTEKKQSG